MHVDLKPTRIFSTRRMASREELLKVGLGRVRHMGRPFGYHVQTLEQHELKPKLNEMCLIRVADRRATIHRGLNISSGTRGAAALMHPRTGCRWERRRDLFPSALLPNDNGHSLLALQKRPVFLPRARWVIFRSVSA
jgi:hypothetical protein